MPNMSPKKNEMPTQAPEVRAQTLTRLQPAIHEERPRLTRRSAVSTARRCPASAAARSTSISPSLSQRFARTISRAHIRSFSRPPLCPQSAAGYVLRNSSAKASAFAASKANPSASADLNALLPIGITLIPPKLPKLRLPTATALQL